MLFETNALNKSSALGKLALRVSLESAIAAEAGVQTTLATGTFFKTNENSKILAYVYGQITSGTSGTDVFLGVSIDGTNVVEGRTGINNGYGHVNNMDLINNISAGTHTINFYMRAPSSTTASCHAYDDRGCFLIEVP